jgi:cytochrome c biogenesis protein CcmG, thiol:disulfide interchange protein DsbE
MKSFFALCTLFTLLGPNMAASASQPQDPDYPPYVMDKKIHATNDLRGKKAPALEVAQWLNSTPPVTDGKVVIMEFWATWCPDCHRLIPELNKLKEKFGDDLVIVGITDEPEPVVNKFLENHKVDAHIGLAPDRKMYNIVGVKGIPQVLVVSADGIVRWQGYADAKEDPLTEEKLALIIKTSKSTSATLIRSDSSTPNK